MFRSLALIVLLAAVGTRDPGTGNLEGQPGSRLPAPGSRQAPGDDAAILHALNRLTYGPRPGDADRVRAMGLQKWIELQLAPSRLDDSGLDRRLARLETLTLDSQTIQRDYAAPAMMERRQRKLATDGNREPGTANREMQDGSRLPDPDSRQASEVIKRGRQVVSDLEEAKLLRAVYSERQLEEVLVDFWFNHFNVFAGKGQTRNYITE